MTASTNESGHHVMCDSDLCHPDCRIRRGAVLRDRPYVGRDQIARRKAAREVAEERGMSVEVGHGDNCVVLMVRGGAVITPDEARLLAIRLIEQARNADLAHEDETA